MHPSSPSDVPPGTMAWIGVTPRQLAGFLAMVFGMFMAILDIQIVSASLTEIQAGLSRSSDEIAWVQTSYLIAEVVMIPLSGFLARVLSTRVLFYALAVGFTLRARFAPRRPIDQMIVYRAMQGFIGGGMIPSVFAVAFSLFPPSKQAIVSPIIGLVATLAPTIGPTVGGYLSDAFSWHWLFLINVGPGIAVATAVFFLVDFDKPDHSLLEAASTSSDWERWRCSSARSSTCSRKAPATIGSTIRRSRSSPFWPSSARSLLLAGADGEEPIVELRAFHDRNFAFGSAFSFTWVSASMASPISIRSISRQVRGYDALMIGETMFVTGIAMFLTAPISGRLSQILDPRVMMLIGFGGFAAGTYIASGVTSDWDFNELLIPQILRGCSLMLCMVPINNLSLGTLPPDQLKNASGLYNLTRNLGGAVGLALINTLLNHRLDLHLARLHESVAWGRPVAEDQLAAMQQNFSQAIPDGAMAALKQLAMLVRRQANVMSFADVFLALTILFATAGIFTILMRKPTAAPVGAH